MDGYEITTRLNGLAAVRAVSETLRRIDERLIDHGDRVAYIACELCEAGKLPLNLRRLFLLSAFHDIGAYKTDEIDRMLEFETRDVWNHSVYGYLFLKYLTPLSGAAEGVLYHHSSWNQILKENTDCGEYAALIHLADRIDIAVCSCGSERLLERIYSNADGLFRPEYVELFRRAERDRGILKRIKDGSFRTVNASRIESFSISPEDALKFMEMIVYAIDFRSEHTVTHTINTVAISLQIARHFGLNEEEQEDIYLGALLHDVGKITIPIEILEKPGRLTAEQMEVMRTHVEETEMLIDGIVPESIKRIAVRHHEKLDGTGYPRGLTGEELTFSQRILAVGDIVSALGSRRSYKEPFPKEKTLKILSEMKGVQLDSGICEYVYREYDSIMEETDPRRDLVIQKYQAIMAEFDQWRKRLETKCHNE